VLGQAPEVAAARSNLGEGATEMQAVVRFPKRRSFPWRGTVLHPLLQHEAYCGARSAKAAIEQRTAVFHESLMQLMQDHTIQGRCLFPGAGFVEMALAVALHRASSSGRSSRGVAQEAVTVAAELREVAFLAPCDLDLSSELTCIAEPQSGAPPHDGAMLDFCPSIKGAVDSERVLCHVGSATAKNNTNGGFASPLNESLAAVQARCVHPVAGLKQRYAALAEAGDHGPQFQTLEQVWRSSGDNELLARLRVPPDSEEFHLHPALLDGVFQLAGFTNLGHAALSDINAVHFVKSMFKGSATVQLPRHLWAHARVTESSAKLLVMDFVVFDGSPLFGDCTEVTPMLVVTDARFRPRDRPVTTASLYEAQWTKVLMPLDDSRASAGNDASRVVLRINGGTTLTSLKNAQFLRAVGHVHAIDWKVGSPFNPALPTLEAASIVLVPLFAHELGSVLPESSASLLLLNTVLDLLQAIQTWSRANEHCSLRVAFLFDDAEKSSYVSSVTHCTETIKGLIRTARIELPLRLLFTCFDLSDVRQGIQMLECMKFSARSGEPNEFALRETGLYQREMSSAATSKIGGHPIEKGTTSCVARNGVALVTGGLGGLGLVTAEALTRAGVSCIVLASRSGTVKYAGQGLEERLSALQQKASGVRVVLERCDTANVDDVAALLHRIRQTHGPLRIVVHAAGVITNISMCDLNVESMKSLWGPKADGAWFLHQHTLGDDLSAFMLYSSLASAIGGVTGNAHYSAANAYLDELARWRVAQGLPAVSVQWPAVSGVGMAAAMDKRVQIANRKSIDGRMVGQVVSQLLTAMALEEPVQAVLPRGLLEPGVLPPSVTALLAAVMVQPEKVMGSKKRNPRSSRSESNASTETLAKWAGKTAETVRAEVQALVVAVAVELLGCVSGELDVAEPLMEAGLDSLGATQLVRELGSTFKLNLSPTLLFDYPTVNALTAHLCDKVATFDGVASHGEQMSRDLSILSIHNALQPSTAEKHQVAIVGMSCRFPGGVEGPAMFWDTLRAGDNCVAKVPLRRWDVDALISTDTTITRDVGQRMRWGGFVDDLELFDAGFFRISPAEASAMDPQQRLLVEYACLAFEDAGCPKGSLEGRNVGVFVGMTATDNSGRSTSPKGVYAANGSAISAAVGRVSFLFGLQGPCAAYDTACSSALVALHASVRCLQHGDCDLALAAAVSTMLSCNTSIATAVAGMTSPTGRCHTFDESADGYARSEGCGAVVLKRLQDALTDRDRIHAVVSCVGVAQDGTSASLTAPNGKAQEKLLRSTLRDGGLAGVDVNYVEAHGTGTALGDPIEMGALAAVLTEDNVEAAGLLVMGAAKASVGHLEPVAGLVGLLKAVLVLQSGQAPCNPELRSLNPKVGAAVADMAVRFPVVLAPLSVLHAGVSSFGYAGTIAHTVLGQAPEVAAARSNLGEGATEMQAAVRFPKRKSFPWKVENEIKPRANGFKGRFRSK
jgi:acyl transferase domain-containing protein/NADP-dependent 3-hydroxy acid dehydrogenase YdfG/acyl carrier protein